MNKDWLHVLLWSSALFLWGAAEATLFFIVPDVLLSFAVLRTTPRLWGLWLISATAGAVLGVEILFFWASLDGNASAWVERVPAISPGMMTSMYETLKSVHLFTDLLLAGVSGIPVKTAAVLAPAAGLSLGQLLIAIIPARMIRFALAIGGAALFARITRSWSSKRRMSVLTLLWVVFYAGFFSLMPN